MTERTFSTEPCTPVSLKRPPSATARFAGLHEHLDAGGVAELQGGGVDLDRGGAAVVAAVSAAPRSGAVWTSSSPGEADPHGVAIGGDVDVEGGLVGHGPPP